MPLIKAQCTNCGGLLDVESGKEAAICPFCGQAYIIEKAIQNYQVNNSFNIANATFNVESEYEKLKNAAEYFLKKRDYSAAAEKYAAILKDYPQKDESNYINHINYLMAVSRDLSSMPPADISQEDQNIIKWANEAYRIDHGGHSEWHNASDFYFKVPTIPHIQIINQIPIRFRTKEINAYLDVWNKYIDYMKGHGQKLWNDTYRQNTMIRLVPVVVIFLVIAFVFIYLLFH